MSLTFALNRTAAPALSFDRFVELAAGLGMGGIEIRNDLLGVELLDGSDAAALASRAAARNLAILSINALQRFDAWDDTRAQEAERLAATAVACGAAGLVLCPTNDRGDERSASMRAQDLRRALRALRQILGDSGLLGLVEPLGFATCALRSKRAAIDAIDAVDGAAVFRLVHDTFHHRLAGETEFFPLHTHLVHVSGVDDPALAIDAMRDADRVLVTASDRLGSREQIRALQAGGWTGPVSFEPFAPSVQAAPDLEIRLRDSMREIRAGLESGRT